MSPIRPDTRKYGISWWVTPEFVNDSGVPIAAIIESDLAGHVERDGLKVIPGTLEYKLEEAFWPPVAEKWWQRVWRWLRRRPAPQARLMLMLNARVLANYTGRLR